MQEEKQPLVDESTSKDNDDNLIANDISFKDSLIENFKESMPIVASSFSTRFSAFWGMRLLAGYGDNFTAAEQIINATLLTAVMTNTMPFLATNQSIANIYHDDDHKGKIINEFVAGMINVALISAPTVFGLGYAGPIMKALGQPSDLIGIVDNFFKTYRYALPLIVTSSLCSNTLTALKNTTPLAVVNILSAGIGIGMQYIFIEGGLGHRQEYETGLAKSLLIQSGASAFLLLCYVSGKMLRHPEWRSQFSVIQTFKSLLKQSITGIVIDITVTAEVGTIFGVSSLVGKKIGARALLDFNVINQYFSLSFPLQIAFRQALTGIIGRLKSMKESFKGNLSPLNVNEPSKNEMPEYLALVRNANRAVYAGIFNSSIVSISQLIVCASLTKQIVNVFEHDATDSDIYDFRILFTLACIGQIFDGIRNMYGAGMIGNKNIMVPLMISLFLILGATVGFTALDLDVGSLALAAVIGINTGTLFTSATVSSLYWHLKESKTFNLSSESNQKNKKKSSFPWDKSKATFHRLPNSNHSTKQLEDAVIENDERLSI